MTVRVMGSHQEPANNSSYGNDISRQGKRITPTVAVLFMHSQEYAENGTQEDKSSNDEKN
jgi:hypothetical protein